MKSHTHPLRFYLLKPVRPWEPFYDKMHGVIVQAATAKAARQLTSQEAGDEGSTAWLDAGITSCVSIRPGRKPRVILRHYREG